MFSIVFLLVLIQTGCYLLVKTLFFCVDSDMCYDGMHQKATENCIP